MRIRRSAGLSVALSLGLLSAGCASKPKPAPVASAPPAPAARAPAAPAPSRAAPSVVQSGPSTSNAPAPGSQQDFIIRAGDRVYFDFESADLRADARNVLDAQAAWLSRYPQVTVRVEGNADERGTRDYNFALGARRAETVREYLINKGVAAARIATVSYGKERPIAVGDDEAAWAKNRNAHTALVSGAP